MNRLLLALSISVRFKRNLVLHTTGKQLNWLGLTLGCCGWLLPTTGITNPVLAAERIYASYAALERSISVAALEVYAKEGKLVDHLGLYTKYLNPQQLAQLRRVLLARADLSLVATSQFFYTSIGETLLERLGQVIQTESRQSGFYALRSALILAAADPEGLTLLNVLRKFPTSSIRVDLARSLQIVEELQGLLNQTNQAIALVKQQSTTETTQAPVNLSQQPDLRLSRGKFTWNKRTLTLNDRRRDRRFLADIYLPKTKTEVPVIVISHGLGSDRNTFEYLAQHLASYGFAVAVPEHPRSSAEQGQSLLAGRSYKVEQPSEFINHPLDVTYLLDQLQRLDSSDPSYQFNLQQVGVIGQSFGGYTALALAGAAVNFDQLQKDCKNLNDSWNVSLLLQCQVLQLPRTQYNLYDPRVKAVIAINPLTSSVFGEASLSKIQVPVMIVSSGGDIVAPALPEQILPFTWLTTPKKYLAVIEGGTHFSTIGVTDLTRDPFILPPQVISSNPAIARHYINALSVAFCQTYVTKLHQYRPYLSAAYAQTISQPPLTLNLIQSLSANQLTQSIQRSTQEIRSKE
ncbi:MAG: alpha/beta hydrolase [Gloeocapsa sp. UFS-A4-WI-NPMV-4B04]|jgi:predicted dienelactone hydrolase|nr:alpha/beta hydrolase [Gloeocapsa sp. UFS-A4-WI-NPMV-4B04]